MRRSPKFQKRHYEVIAKCLSQFDVEIRAMVAPAFVAEFAADNPYFNSYRFLKAAGVPTSK